MTPSPTPLDAPAAFRRRARYVVALVTAVVVALFVLWTTREAVLLAFLGVAVAVLFYDASRWLAARTGAPRRLALAAVVLAVVGGLAAVVVGWGPSAVAQGQALLDAAPEVLAAVRDRLGLPAEALTVPDALRDLGGRLLGWFSTASGVVTGLIVVVVVAAYGAGAPERYTSAVARLVDVRHQPTVHAVLGEMAAVLRGWLKGVGIAVAVLLAMAYPGLLLIGVPGALALSAFAAALTVVPTFGPIVGWAPALAVAFAHGTTTGLWTLGLAVVVQQIEGDVITPKVQGDLVRVAPGFVVAGQIVLGALTGFLGILLVVPILGCVRVLVQRLYIGPFVAGEAAVAEGS